MKSFELNPADEISSNQNDTSTYNPDQRLEYPTEELSLSTFNYDLDLPLFPIHLDKCLQPFKDENWTQLDEDEKWDAVLDLKEAIENDLYLTNDLGLAYYEGDNPMYYGSYLPQDCMIVINRNLLDRPEQLVKTLSHELRHAWQEALIRLPENEHDEFIRLLDFNNENYIRPEDNYLAYRNQPMEIDAREYADAILSILNDNWGQ